MLEGHCCKVDQQSCSATPSLLTRSRNKVSMMQVWSEPSMVEAGAYEFADTAKFLAAGIWLSMALLFSCHGQHSHQSSALSTSSHALRSCSTVNTMHTHLCPFAAQFNALRCHSCLKCMLPKLKLSGLHVQLTSQHLISKHVNAF